MRSLLTVHPRIAIAPETHYMDLWVEKYQHLDFCQREDFDVFWETFSQSDRFSYLGIDADSALDRILAKGTPNYRNVFVAILEEYAQNNNKERWGEKTPAHYAYVDVLLNWFPGSRIIWMIRDPRAVCASYFNVPWFPKHILRPARRWRSSMRELAHWQNNWHVKIVRYEDLVSDPNNTINKVFLFLEEQPVSDIQEVRQSVNIQVERRDEWERQHLDIAFGPIDSRNIDKWKSQLNNRQVKLVEYLTCQLMPLGNYACISSWNPLFMKIWAIWAHVEFVIILAFSKRIFEFLRHRSLPVKKNV